MLADLCRLALTGKGEPPAGAGDDACAALALETRMTSPAARGFERAGCAVPAALARASRSARAWAAISNGRVQALACIAFPVLARAGIAVVAFKGPFQHRQLHGDPFFFRSGDLDLLVAQDDFEPALAAFKAEGFVRREGTTAWWTSALGEVHLVHPEGGVIDLHHRLQQPGCPPPRDLGAFLRKTQPERVGAVEIAVPTKVQAVLICALNFTKEFAHRRRSARYAFDVATGLLGMDEAEHRSFAATVTDQRLAGTVGLAAALCETIFAVSLPLAPPLRAERLPRWADRASVRAMAFDPEGKDTPWPRRREILWAMCSGTGRASKAAEFSREAARMIASEALRRTAPAAAG